MPYPPMRAGVVDTDHLTMRIRVSIGYTTDERAHYVTQIGGDAGAILTPGELGAIGPTLDIPEEVARALLDALTRHFHGGSDTRQLRADYDAERARVDRLIAIIAPPAGITPVEKMQAPR